jgi:hypothetical protein
MTIPLLEPAAHQFRSILGELLFDGLDSGARVCAQARPRRRLPLRLIRRNFAYSSPAIQSDAFGLRPRNDSTQREFVLKEIQRMRS